MARVSNLIIPTEYLDNVLNGATDEDGRLTDAVTRATAFVNTYAVNYLEFDAYTVNENLSSSSSSSSESSASESSQTDESSNSSSSSASSSADEMDEDIPDTYTINAPRIIEQICLQVAVAMYKLSLDETYRNGDERKYWEDRLAEYRTGLQTIDIEPEQYSKSISLNTYGNMLIARKQNIIPWNATVTSNSTNVWSNGEHFSVRKGGLYSTEHRDGWYFDASTYLSTMEGTLFYYRSYRKDTKDYMKTMTNDYQDNLYNGPNAP